jgi:hypothetical protein
MIGAGLLDAHDGERGLRLESADVGGATGWPGGASLIGRDAGNGNPCAPCGAVGEQGLSLCIPTVVVGERAQQSPESAKLVTRIVDGTILSSRCSVAHSSARRGRIPGTRRYTVGACDRETADHR